MDSIPLIKTKPLARGYIHLTSFFIAAVACIVLVMQSNKSVPNIVYGLTLTGMYGVSALYHLPNWGRENYLFLRRIDHAAIFALIAGTATPICLLGLNDKAGLQLILILWSVGIIGIIIMIFWTHAPKWVRALLCIFMGWIGILYFPEIKSLGTVNMRLLIGGGIIYTLGALVYALKYPNPFPRVFGYHEIFHFLVVIASALHFAVIYRLTV